MKFKTIFLAFNIILLLSFLFIFFLPFTILGWEYTKLFWGNNWYLALAFFLVLASLNGYFIKNWKLFNLLEGEDWKRVRAYLEAEIFTKNKSSSRNIRILINTYMVLSDAGGIGKLEKHLREKKPEFLPLFGLELGLPYLMKNEPEKMDIHYSELENNPKTKNREWVLWNLAFARMILKKFETAKKILDQLAASKKDPVLHLLTIYLLGAFRNTDTEILTTVKQLKEEFRGKYTEKSLTGEIEKSKADLHVIVLLKLIEDATAWVFSEAEN